LLGGLLLAAFLPLFFAVSTYARFTLREVRETSAKSLGRAVAAQVFEERAVRPEGDIAPLLRTHVGVTGLLGIAVLDRAGLLVARAGDDAALTPVGTTDLRQESVHRVSAARGRALAVVAPGPSGTVIALIHAEDEASRVEPLVRLSGLYMGLVALALLFLSYFALTRLIVGPLDELSRAARRVAAGARRLEVPRSGSRELVELGEGLSVMTEKLLNEEEALRRKVEEVESATRSLQEAQVRLVRSERLASVGRLAAGLAHEVGNPIAAMIGLQDLWLEGGLDEDEQRDFMTRMRKETERINTILRDLLAFARPTDTRTSSSAEPGNVESAIYDTVTLLTPQKSMRDVDLAVDVHPDLPLVAMTSEQLVQILLNLLLNAADACGEGGHILVRAEASDFGTRLVVEDDGPGIAADVEDRLFEPFVTSKDVGKGTGLGLAVCRGLVEAAGGTIALDKTHPKGARFIIELPRAKADASE
jgi:signal transduction histidine kinase